MHESGQSKIRSLESARGIAALIVLICHVSLGLYPAASGIFPELKSENSLQGSLLYAGINGSAAVVFFFVLSGYVLSKSFFQTGNYEILIRNIIKRLPRLAFLTTVVTLISFLLFYFELYRHEATGKMTSSPWLVKFGYAYDQPFAPDLWGAITQGLYKTFYTGESHYNSVMWTMKIEFYGSFLVFGLAGIINMVNRPVAAWIIFLLALTLAETQSIYYIAFVVGVILAKVTKEKKYNNKIADLVSIFIVIYLFGYSGTAQGIYTYFAQLAGNNTIYIWILASVIFLNTAIRSKNLQQALENRLLVYLGWISFPLYLIHVPILCSLGSSAYLITEQTNSIFDSRFIAATLTIASSIIAATFLAKINDSWLKHLNSVANKAISKDST